MDEIGVPLEPQIVAKGQKKVHYQTSGQNQKLTMIDCASATG